MLPINTALNARVNAFCSGLEAGFNDPDPGFSKGDLKFLVDEIRVEDKQTVMMGSQQALAEVVSPLNSEITAGSVATSKRKWRARRESNPRPLASEANTLSI